MSTSLVLFLIVIIIIAARHKRDRQYFDRRLNERDRLLDEPPALPDNSRLEREVDELRDRVKVLERIVTDSNNAEARESRRISEEIEALRTSEHS